uniref:Uncharacterized protein n=1 Tax=Panagrolaimus sp. JU765 TaxID=591449 RepID=A0AC34RDR7_9BILA
MQLIFVIFVFIACFGANLAFKLQPGGGRAVEITEPATLAEKLALYSVLMHDLHDRHEEPGQQVRRSMAKERRAPLETLWEGLSDEGMMQSLDNLRKPRFG